jgi:hypothetical protein
MTSTEQKTELTKEQALEKFLNSGIEKAEETTIENEFECNGETYLVLTDEEADAATAQAIEESLWAFNASFLAAYMPEGIGEEEINSIRGDRCEDANEVMIALVNAGRGLKTLVNDAIGSDGRGHFLNHYDSEENESECGDYYFYRT